MTRSSNQEVNPGRTDSTQSFASLPRRRAPWSSSGLRHGGATGHELLGGLAVPAVLVILVVTFSILSPHIFFTSTNLSVIVSGQAILLMLALAVTIPLRSGDFDLSVSSVMILTACSAAVLSDTGIALWVSILLCLAVGLVVGVVNSFFVVILNLDGMIVTLGMLTILTGLAGLVSGNQIVTNIPAPLMEFASQRVVGLPTVVWIGWAMALVLWYLFEYTPIGRYLLFIGGNRSAAHLAGIKVSRMRCGALIAASIISAVAGVLLAGTLGAVDPTSHGAYLLPPFTAAFLGASAIQLGRFNIVGTLVGLYILAVGIAGLQLLGFQGWIADLFNGACLICAVTFARAFRRHAA